MPNVMKIKDQEGSEIKLEQIKVIFDHLPYLAWLKDKNGKYIAVNRPFEERYGVGNAQVIGKTIFDFADENLAAQCTKADQAAIESKIPQRFEELARKKTGGTRWLDIYVAPILDDHGEVIGTMGTSRKITKRKRLEIELTNQKKFLQTMIDTIPDLVFYKDVNSVFLGGNKAFSQKVFGLSEEELIGKTDFDLVKDIELAAYYRKKDQEMLQAKTTIVNEETIVMVDGRANTFETSKTPFYDQQGNIAGLIGISRDITDRKHMEEELIKKEQLTQQELNLAARIQEESLPLPFTGKKVKVDYIFKPHHTVSGDLINYKWFEKQQKLRGYVVDVSGHGISTALQTATVKMLLDNKLLSGTDIGEEDFQYINRRMLQYLSEESFAAVIYFEFDFKTMMLTAISAGVNLFFIAKPYDSALVPLFSCYLGLLDSIDIETLKIPFHEGQLYGMMSDGVSDLMEFRGCAKKENFAEYQAWLEELTHSPDLRDDFSVISIEILSEKKDRMMLQIQNQKELEEGQLVISEFIEEHAPNCAGMLEVAVNEALNNGFRAGQQVCMKGRKIGNRLIFRIKDDGPGFSTEKVNAHLRKPMEEEEFDAEFDEILLAEGGRGILIMKMFSDKLMYNQKGNEVLLMKKI